MTGEASQVEYGQLDVGGAVLLRAPDIDGIYPLDDWIKHRQRRGGKVLKRTVIVVEDWVEVTQP